MVKGFWKKLKKPIYALAPMANVTDAAFRRMIAKYGKPDVMWTEFVSCEGLCSAGKETLLIDLWYDESERPIVAQLSGADPASFYKCAQLARELGFDGIDINMGCPDKSVEKQGAGAALIKNPKLAVKIIQETKRGAGSLPVSVKTRVGYNEVNLAEWVKILLDAEIAALIIHARTRKELSKVPANWDLVRETVEIAKKIDPSSNRTLILGNGDVKNFEEAEKRIKETDADGVMVGRGVFGNPWFFNRKKISITPEKKLSAMIEHAFLYEKLFDGKKGFATMRKHFKAYTEGFKEARKIRVELMKTKTASEALKIIKKYYPNIIK